MVLSILWVWGGLTRGWQPELDSVLRGNVEKTYLFWTYLSFLF